MAASGVLWWKFQLPGVGSHLLRVKDIGLSTQEVHLDGVPLEAPPGTTTFTGPGASLLELQQVGGGWALLCDGATIESYNPEMAPAEAPSVAWWKFTTAGAGTHHLRVKGIGSPSQEILLDGTPLDAPVGTMAFTGPGGALLELQRREGLWVLVVDGAVVHQTSPHSGGGTNLIWDLALPTGQHRVQVSDAGGSGQEVFVDGILVPAPPGQLAFTGPGGVLLELRSAGDAWTLLADGAEVSLGGGAAGVGDASWNFVEPRTALQHRLQAMGLGGSGQSVFLDGELIPAPPGQTAFTGPGGLLLELKCTGAGWALFVDSQPVDDHNARAGTAVGEAPKGSMTNGRAPVSAAALPQGVSLDSATGRYTANIRVKGRFKCLGDFQTPEEAHTRYLDAKREFGEA